MTNDSGLSKEFEELLKNADNKDIRNKNHDSEGSSSKDSPSSGNKEPVVEKVQFSPLYRRKSSGRKMEKDFFDDIPFVVSGELGTTDITVRELLKLKEGSVIKLNKMAGDNASMLVNERYFGEGEVVVVNDRFGLRITSITKENENIQSQGGKGKEKEKTSKESSSPDKEELSSEELSNEEG